MNCPPLSLVHTSKYSSIIPAQFRGFVDRQFRSICKSIYSPSHAIRLLCVLPRLALPQQLVHTLWPFFRAKDVARCSWRGSGGKGLDTKKDQGRRLARWRKTFQAWVTSLLPWHLVGLPACQPAPWSPCPPWRVWRHRRCAASRLGGERGPKRYISGTQLLTGVQIYHTKELVLTNGKFQYSRISQLLKKFFKLTSRSFPFGSCLQRAQYFLFDGYMNFNKT